MFLQQIQHWAQAAPQRAACVQQGERLTYRALWSAACRLSSALRQQGDGPVLIYGEKSPRVVTAFLACLLCGRPYVPCSPAFPPQRIATLAGLCGAAAVVPTDGAAPGLPLPVITWEASLSAPPLPFSPPPASHTAYLLLTSGSTGAPKCVPITVGNLQNFLTWAQALPALRPALGGATINQAALTFDLSVADVYLTLTTGGTLHLFDPAPPEPLRALFPAYAASGATLLVCTPTFLQLCLCSPDFTQALLPRLRAVWCCGEVLSPTSAAQWMDRFPSAQLINAYGPTEATCAVTAVAVTRQMLGCGALPIGEVAHSAVSVTIRDARGASLPDGATGEITLEGASVFSGYQGAPPQRGPYATGDHGFVRDGLLYFCGRRDSQIKWKGYRIDLAEVETALARLPGLRQAAVLPVRAPDGAVLRLTAYGDWGDGPPPADWRRQLGEILPDYMLPSRLLPFKQLPVSDHWKRRRVEDEVDG